MTAAAAKKTIRQAAGLGEPFFIMVGFHKPHTPFNAPAKYWDLYERDQIPLAVNPDHPKNAPHKYAVHNSNYVRSFKDIPESGQLPDELAREIKHSYYACISFVDSLVGGLVKELEATGQLENTVIVFTSDHGYHLGEHSLWSKHTNFERSTRVPLFVSIPNGANNGQSTDSLVELVDLFPTLAELAGLPLPDHLEGRSFAKLMFDSQASGRTEAFSEFTRQGARGCSIRTERFRYVEWRDLKTEGVVARELYDHAKDPHENENVAAEEAYAEEVSRLSKQLASRL